jgi:hypothetical protein
LIDSESAKFRCQRQLRGINGFGTPTFDSPVFFTVPEQHDEFIGRKSSKIGNREDLGETILERLDLDFDPFANDGF